MPTSRFRLVVFALSLVAGTIVVAAATGEPAEPRPLSLEARVEAQWAIERVYWSHRTWPADNPQPKPPLEQMVSDGAIREKVDDYLKKSSALGRYWSRPITGEQLQAEMVRMARDSRQPEVLRELFAALGDDPVLIAETLVRQSLADRLVRRFFARDERVHGALGRTARTAAAADPSVQRMSTLGGRYVELTWKLFGEGAGNTREREDGAEVSVDPDEWTSLVEGLSRSLGIAPTRGDDGVRVESLPVLRRSAVIEDDDGFHVIAVLDRGAGFLRTASTTWSKVPFDEWWASESRGLDTTLEPAVFANPSLPVLDSGCIADTWSPTRADNTDARWQHVAVWTGTEMIVWGGIGLGGALSSGSRYVPVTDTWTPTSKVNVPAGRGSATAVWTGNRMIVWGGEDDDTNFDTGGQYDPSTDSWTATSGVAAPSARRGHTAVWTGTEMIVWGGVGESTLNTGGRYSPSDDSWTATSTGTNVPSQRQYHSAVWTGTEMIVWGGGGTESPYLNNGGRYDPSDDTWTATSTGVGVPSVRLFHTAVWTGSEMVIWGGFFYSKGTQQVAYNTGGRYSPVSDAWTPTTTVGAPNGRYQHSGLWTGSRMLVWGGTDYWIDYRTGGRYDPASDSWAAISIVNAPTERCLHTAVWTGSEMIVWGGGIGPNSTGGRYDPVGDSWVPTGIGTTPAPRRRHTAVWTGSEMIVWGGDVGGTLQSGGRYVPATDTWSPTSVVGAPAGRIWHTALWTGSRMVVWGGSTDFSNIGVKTGGRYDPVSDSWAPTNSADAPAERILHTTVWTGTSTIVWGGSSGLVTKNTGSSYNPAADTWTPTSGANAPAARDEHVAVWTGAQMVVWGGYSDSSGGRYDPGSDTWTATSTASAPQDRNGPAVVWTGSQMVVWGGKHGPTGTILNTGGRYAPSTGTWTPVSIVGAPSARQATPGVWTGSDMIVWGGLDTADLDTGGRYDPAADTWTATGGTGAPAARSYHTAVYSGTEMIVWGGSVLTATGGRYCACPQSATFFRDADDDGFGSSADTITVCSGIPPAGYAEDSGDCEDADGAVYPGAPQICDGKNNDCSDPAWPAVPANEADADGDGFRICAGDCDDLDATVYPGATQLCDGKNNDCSDPVWPAVPANEADADGDGFRICAGDCNDLDATVYPGATQLCDGKNNDCSDPSWPAMPPNEADADGDGYRICQNDCDDGLAAINPGATEVCNGTDDDCDGLTDEDALGEDSDGDGVKNLCDNCRTTYNPDQIDSDGDRVGNACDNCISVPNPSQTDTDGDQRGDVCDNCPAAYNPAQDDTDSDRVGDACDNCLDDSNPAQSDFDGDHQGDACDIDDGLIYIYSTDENFVEWQQEAGPTSWNVYEGDLSVLRGTGVYTQAPGSNDLADRHCGLTDPWVEDPTVPAAGKVKFSLVTGMQNGTEWSLGTDSEGLERPNTNPCP